MKAIHIVAFGKPAEVLKVVDVPDVGAPDANEVVIALEVFVRIPVAARMAVVGTTPHLHESHAAFQ